MSTTANPEAVVVRFFDAYRARDVESMVDLCGDNCEFDYVPAEAWGKQRVVHAHGKVRGIGKTVWVSLIDSFPDLTNTVQSTASDAAGNVAVEVSIGGHQAKAFGAIGSTGQRYDLPHLFMFHVDGDGLIDSIRAYWDSSDWYRQLGWKEVG